MSQVNFKLSENIVLNGYTLSAEILDNGLYFNGDKLATETFVSDAIQNISIPPAFITSVSGNLSVDVNGNLTLNEGGIFDDAVDGSTYLTHYAGYPLDVNLSALETQLTNDGYAKTSDIPPAYITSVNETDYLSVTDGVLDISILGLEQNLAGHFVDGSYYLTSQEGGFGAALDINISALETQLTTDGFAKTSDIPSLSGYVTETGTETLSNKNIVDLTIKGKQDFYKSDADGGTHYGRIGSNDANNLVIRGYQNDILLASDSNQVYIGYISSDNKVAKISDIPSLSGYATESFVTGQGYITNSALSGYATETYVGNAINDLVNGAPAALNTLKELADAINDDASYASTITTALGGKQATLTAGNGIQIDNTNTISLNPDVIINSVSLTDVAEGIKAETVLFGNKVTSTYSKGSAQSLYTFATGTVASDILLNIVDTAGNSRTSKLTAVFNGGAAPVWTEYGIVDSAATGALSATVSFSGNAMSVNVDGSGTYAVYGMASNMATA